MKQVLFIATIFNDFYDSEAGFSGTIIGTNEEVVKEVNKYGETMCEEYGIPTTPHEYGDDVDDIKCEQSVYQPLVVGETYDDHLLFEDDNTNRIYVQVVKLEMNLKVR